MKAFTVNTYSFDELSISAKRAAVDWYRDKVNGFEADVVIEDAKSVLGLLGFSGVTVVYSGFGSQGDGASFEARFEACEVKAGGVAEYAPKDEDLNRLAKAMELLAAEGPTVCFSVSHEGQYAHEFCTRFEFDDEAGLSVETEGAFIDVSRGLMKWIYRRLESEWVYQNSDGYVIECIRDNDYAFTAEGKRSVTLGGGLS